MGRNIEIKARAGDLVRLIERVEALSGAPCQVIEQCDTFYRANGGRLKLRKLGPERGELIFYDRPDVAGPKASRYAIAGTREPAALGCVLQEALGACGEVRKTRRLALVGQTRVHVDEVDGLGSFLELEVVLREGQSEADGTAVARDLMERLGVGEADLVRGAYLDLLQAP